MKNLLANAVIIVSGMVLMTNFANAKIDPTLPQSPWQKNAVLTSSKISPIYRQQWAKSDIKKVCPILALPTVSPAQLRYSKARPASFSGGWSVAYDVTKTRDVLALRSGYGVANAGTSTESRLYKWQNQTHYADGSYVTYGHEGNDPNGKMLAYVLLDNGCFYNVWSKYGEAHLVKMLNDLHYVK